MKLCLLTNSKIKNMYEVMSMKLTVEDVKGSELYKRQSNEHGVSCLKHV
jgi:hypothetical protein